MFLAQQLLRSVKIFFPKQHSGNKSFDEQVQLTYISTPRIQNKVLIVSHPVWK